ncbi:Hypothetical predicted protein [Xyrichtys novacula]|uniref:Uncharacterized protein n=1 Tax=Xyrichtys novacula TaxID=13765 RepID=A0AAV1G218_XYRNO|nr:Hypothetical predicted protein [Xyrichtys novacula]
MAICSPHVREQRPTWWQTIGEGEGLEPEPRSRRTGINLQRLEEQNSHKHILGACAGTLLM